MNAAVPLMLIDPHSYQNPRHSETNQRRLQPLASIRREDGLRY
jgi:hypothetical protein